MNKKAHSQKVQYVDHIYIIANVFIHDITFVFSIARINIPEVMYGHQFQFVQQNIDEYIVRFLVTYFGRSHFSNNFFPTLFLLKSDFLDQIIRNSHILSIHVFLFWLLFSH